MSKNDILRLALVLAGNQAQNFTTNLRKIVKLVLFDNYQKSIKLSTIVQCISERYMLEFDEYEILASIKDDKGIVIIKGNYLVDNLYSITPLEYEKIKGKQNSSIDEFIQHFLSENTSVDISFEDTKDLIYKFLYYTFNSDTKTVLELLNKEYNHEKETSVTDEFSVEESEVINKFLNWDNKSKNEYILNMISACFDYCMLTVKKDSTSFSQVFNGKSFFLDSNIIFRLAGFNKEERKTVLDAFIRKCKMAGIKICYTNQTNEEIKNTIKYYVDCLKKLLSNQQPISIEAMSALSSKYANLDFYEKYAEWCKSPLNCVGDFQSFTKYLEREVLHIINEFKLVVMDSYELGKSNNKFGLLVEDFTKYKTEHYRNTYEGAIKIDINNYLFMLDKNNDGQASNFLELKYYFITADHCLTEWASMQRPGTVPIFVLPSVWYSILLKYKGRTDEDYLSFCRFLNIRIAPERDPLIVHKQAMLSYILEMDEEKEIKESVIFDIEARLKEDNTDIEDPILFAEESHRTIMEIKLAERTQELREQHKADIERMKERTQNEHESKLEEIRNRNAIEIDNAKEEGFCSGQEVIIDKQAKKIVKRNKVIIGIGMFVVFVLIICTFLSLVVVLLKDRDVLKELPQWVPSWLTMDLINWYEKHAGIFAFIDGLLTTALIIVEKLLKNIGFLLTEKEKVKEKLKDKYR